MKKLIYLFFWVCLVTSCNEQPIQSQEDIVPKSVVNAVRQAYPEATDIVYTTLEADKFWQADFMLKIQKMSVTVNNAGQITEAYNVARVGAALPEAAQKFINLNYPGATIVSISEQLDEKQKVIGYKVVIKTKEGKEVVMLFDTTGAITMLVVRDSTTTTKPETKTYTVEQKDLPETIKKVLTEKHGEYKYVKGMVIIENGKRTYYVTVSKEMTNFEYVFDENGVILKSSAVGVGANPENKVTEKAIEKKEDIPAKILEFLNREFKTWEFQKGIITYQGDKVVGYLVVIKYDNKLVYAYFDGTGALRGTMSGGQETIDPTKLPEAIQKAIAAIHKDGYKITSVTLKTTDGKKTYVILVVKNNITYYYEMDETGKILASKTIPNTSTTNSAQELPLDLKDLPEKAKEYLNKNYAGWTYLKGITTLKEGKVVKYLVAIKVGEILYYVYFDGTGAFLEARKG